MSGEPVQNGKDVVLAMKGDQGAFERLYRAHHGRVYSLALRMAGPLWAEDLTQDVFIRAWTKLETFRQEASFGTWLYRLAVNLILSKRETLRKRQQRKAPGGDDALRNLATKEPPPGMAMDFEVAIQKLPNGAREVFVLYEIQGFPHADIGELMGISVGTSKSQLHRARMMLREHLR